jgi:hypothetical protein
MPQPACNKLFVSPFWPWLQAPYELFPPRPERKDNTQVGPNQLDKLPRVEEMPSAPTATAKLTQKEPLPVRLTFAPFRLNFQLEKNLWL